ncbi:reverse transcriptase domain-containing protein [Tanacetum coccineum]
MSVRLADRSFQYPVGIAENMLVEVGNSPFLLISLFSKWKRIVKFPSSWDDPFFILIDDIDGILEEDFDALDEGSKILHSIEGTLLEEEIFAEFNEFMAMTADEYSDSKPDTEDPSRISFRLCNAPATFQRCMLAIFHDMIEESVEVFMDDFFVFRNSFDKCLNNIDKMLQHCKDAHIVLNWEKCHFMVKEGIMLGHKVSGAGLEVDKVKNQRNLKTSTPY